nr:MAG TPA: hypothetical protein [Caudoviricetes sp.]
MLRIPRALSFTLACLMDGHSPMSHLGLYEQLILRLYIHSNLPW